jgi:hypothetical protein
MASRERRRSRRREVGDGSLTKNIFAGILLIGVAAAISAFVFFYNSEKTKIADIDSKTFCQKSILPESTVILVDHTDEINPMQRASLENRLWDVASDLKKNGSIKLFSVAKIKSKVLSPEIDLCNPGSDRDANELTENKLFAKKNFEEKFRKPLNGLLDEVFESEGAKQSPIMEALQSVVVTNFIGNRNSAKIKRVIIVSDLLEHTEDFSMYKGVPDFKTYKSSPHWPKVKSDMENIEVTIFFRHRAGEEKLQTSALRNFWVDYLEAQGASVTRFVPIEG